MFVVDTNVLVYAADRSSPFHEACHRSLGTWRQQTPTWFLTWSILYEFLRVTTHPRVFPRPWTVTEAWKFVEAILASPGVQVVAASERHSELLRELITELPELRGNILHDAHTAVLMREHGIRVIYTRDAGFHRFPFLEVRDPIR